jgi:hypothetical protein
MLVIKANEGFNEKTKEFVDVGEDLVVELEHSLISLSKWEMEYQKPFLSSSQKTPEEVFGYLKAMSLTPNVGLEDFKRCSYADLDAIQKYIDSPMSATTFGLMPETRGPREVVTAELIYYWMIGFQIPWEAQYWHLNRLFTLIRVCNVKNGKPKKMSKREIAEQNARLNAQRRAELGSRG